MVDTKPDIGPSGRGYLDQVRSSAGGAQAPSPSSGSGSSDSGGTGSGSSGSSGGSGSGGGNTGNSSPSGNAGGRRGMSVRTWMLTICSVITGLAMVFLIMWRTSPAGVEIQKSENVLQGKQAETEKILAEKKLVDAQRRLIAQQQVDKRTTPPVVTSTNCIDASGAGIKRVQAIELRYGTCVTFAATGSQSAFWVSFNGPPREIIAKQAAFGSFHEATDTDRSEWLSWCLGQSKDREYCEAESQKRPFLVRDDTGCGIVTPSDASTCLAYLKRKAEEQGTIPVRVMTHEAIQINM